MNLLLISKLEKNTGVTWYKPDTKEEALEIGKTLGWNAALDALSLLSIDEESLGFLIWKNQEYDHTLQSHWDIAKCTKLAKSILTSLPGLIKETK